MYHSGFIIVNNLFELFLDQSIFKNLFLKEIYLQIGVPSIYKKIVRNSNFLNQNILTFLQILLLVGPHRSAPSPAYNGAAASSTHYQNTSVVLNDNNCPYYQLYGPPPSYETVIAQTRGKISSPTSPDHSTLQSTVLQTPSIPPCFAHSYSPSRINSVLENPNFRGTEANPNQHIDGFDTAYPHFAGATNLLRRQDFCILRRPINLGRLSACSEPENPLQGDNSSAEKYSIQRIDCASGSREHSHCEVCAEESIIKMQGRSEPKVECRVHQKPELSRSSTTVTIPSDLDENLEKCERRAKIEWEERSEKGGKCERGDTPRVQGGSLKLFRNSDRKNLCPRFYEVVKNERSSREENSMGEFLRESGSVENSGDLNLARVATTSGTTRLNEPSRHDVLQSTSSFQSNPSNNVILAPFTFNAVNNSPLPNNVKENDQHRLLTARQGSTNLNLESKCKLDRSRSLD